MENTPKVTSRPSNTQSRNRRGVLFAVVAVSTALVALPVLAHGRGRGHGHGGKIKRMTAKLLETADATDAQKKQIEAIVQKHTQALKEGRKEKRGSHKAMFTLLADPNINEAKAEAIRQEMLQHADSQSAIMKDMMLSISKVLRPDQRQKVADAMKKFQEKRKNRRGRRGQGRKGK